MKKHSKRLLAVLLAAIQLFMLCGCSVLDEMRAAQAYFSEEGDVLWNGGTYKKLPASEYLCPVTEYEDLVYVTEPDVPVLLSGAFSLMQFYIAQDDRFLLYVEDEEAWYCEASIYEDMLERINKPFEPEIVCYSYEEYGEEPYESETALYTLTKEQAAVITTVVQNTEPTILQDGMYLDTLWTVPLEECSQDMLFRRSTMDISYTGSTYYLELYTDQGSFLFTVPAACNDQFDQITAAYRASEEAWEAFWSDEEYYEDEEEIL